MAKSGRRRGSKTRGWGVPFPKVGRKPGGFTQGSAGPRTDQDLQHLQQEWVIRYTERVRAHRLLGVSMGTPLEDIEESHRLLVAHLTPGDPRRWKLDQALQLVQATAEVGSVERHDGTALLAGDEASDRMASAGASGEPGFDQPLEAALEASESEGPHQAGEAAPGALS